MKTTMIIRTAFFAAVASLAGIAVAAAAGGTAEELKHHEWQFDGPFGTYDKDALQRGFQVYETVCASCHGLNLLSFRNLGQKGGPFYLDTCPEGFADSVNCSNPNENPIVKAIASQYRFQVVDGPDDSGDMVERAPKASDRIPGPYPNDVVGRLANNGALPPDLSLITKARHHGPDYVYSLLTGYEDAPATVEIAPGQNYNPYFHGDMSSALRDEFLDDEGHAIDGIDVPLGGVLAMAPPLFDGVIDYVDEETPETVEQYAADVTEFLTWAAEPKMEARKAMGVMSMIYLLILCVILYWSYRKVWAKLDH